MYKNNCSILGLTKGSCKFTTSDFPSENPRTQNRTILIRARWQQAEKMNRLIINITAILISSICFSQNLKMELEIQTCVDTSLQNIVTFIIENPTDSNIWINPRYLTFYFGVYSNDGDMISRKTTRHLNGLESDYIKVEKKSKKTLKWTADFFENYQFELNKEYYLECGYEPPYLSRKEKKKLKESNIILSENKFSGKSNLFRICKI